MWWSKQARERMFLDRIEGLSRQLAEVQGELTDRAELLGMAQQYEEATRQLSDARIQISEINEAHARERREIEHKVGLHKIQVEQEIKHSRKEAELTVREEAQTAERERFAQEMEFMQRRMTDEIESQRALMNQILERLPSFHRTHQTVEHIGDQPTPPPTLKIEQAKE